MSGENPLLKILFEGKQDTDYISRDGDVISEKLKSVLEKYTSHNLKFIPFKAVNRAGNEKTFFSVKFLTNENCIDLNKSDITLSRNRIRKINHLVLSEDCKSDFFKIDMYDYDIVISDKLKAIFETENIKGIEYIPIDENYKV
ncbi:imm11 family protein [Aureibacter tunicatorum]|uniref:Immunity MXAN-0049 protein domain-containing protein n=1 Tax=Aureibacter tunicatorum TaxID=866807 RepID=A0AAE3XTW7_9BACT|nr:DUF1629 domain-containing protein [Aureibacter tunicatorum]MDR6241801.1 hypothetical protein [Aureibacter tunicatorum]BDD07048.1 hypothetical protein AUTU_45310 [Aureibacter tunicatorum]